MSTILLQNINFHTLKLRKIKFLSVSRQKLSPLRLSQTKIWTKYTVLTCTLQEGHTSNAINWNCKCLWDRAFCFIQLWIAVTQHNIPKRCIYFWTVCISMLFTGLLSRPNVDMWQFYYQYVTVLLLRYNVTYVLCIGYTGPSSVCITF